MQRFPNAAQTSYLAGPGAYDIDAIAAQNRPPTRTGNHAVTDRLAVLQRKLEDLERIHVEEKKAVSLPLYNPQKSPIPSPLLGPAPSRAGAAQTRAQPRAKDRR